LNTIVNAAGSRWSLGFVLLLLVAWGIWGIIINATDTWQVVLQDVSSLQAYFSATLLMRQQNNNTRGLLSRICGLISRSKSNERMIRSLTTAERRTLATSTHKIREDVLEGLHTKEDAFDRFSNRVAKIVGHLISLGIYTAAIIAWVFLGIPSQFSDTWQLWVNTGTALEITFVTMFLQNIRRQHEIHMEKTVKSIDLLDRELEMQLRRMTGDITPNPTVASTSPPLSGWVRAIDIYAFIIGGSIGLTISAIVLTLWIAVGEPMNFDDNWFLIIGTYTGLIGFIDGFILKNVDSREAQLAEKHFRELLDQDAMIFSAIGIQMPLDTQMKKLSLNQRLSAAIGRACGSCLASYLAIFTVIALLIVATAMQWTETGQLLCNTPTMIVEGFLLILLLQAHNMDDEKRR
ncbi:Low affinity iron permease, partial [Cryphonectria parasitica EP155]